MPDGMLWPVRAANALMAFGNGGTLITPPSMTADAVDADELQSGVAQMGGHMAFLASVFKFGMGLGLFLGLGFLSWFGYVDLGQVLNADVEQGVRIGASWLPAAMLILPVLMMWTYPIDSRAHAVIRERLAIARQSREIV